MADLAPDGRARLAGKRGTDIGKVRGEGAIFCGKRSDARLVRRGSSRSIAARADRERKAQDAFAEKERRVGRECPHAGGGILREQERAYIGRSGREQSGKPLYAAAATAGEGRASPYGKNKAAFRAAFLRKTKPRQIGVSDGHRVARIPTILKGSKAASFCFRRR